MVLATAGLSRLQIDLIAKQTLGYLTEERRVKALCAKVVDSLAKAKIAVLQLPPLLLRVVAYGKQKERKVLVMMYILIRR
jgi:hypothetical protein